MYTYVTFWGSLDLIWLTVNQFDQEWSSWHMWLAGHNGSGSLSVDQRPFVHLQSNRQARQACVTCLHKSLMKKQGKTKRSDATFNIGRNWIVLSTSQSWYKLNFETNLPYYMFPNMNKLDNVKIDIFWTLAKPKNNARWSEHALQVNLYTIVVARQICLVYVLIKGSSLKD